MLRVTVDSPESRVQKNYKAEPFYTKDYTENSVTYFFQVSEFLKSILSLFSVRIFFVYLVGVKMELIQKIVLFFWTNLYLDKKIINYFLFIFVYRLTHHFINLTKKMKLALCFKESTSYALINAPFWVLDLWIRIQTNLAQYVVHGAPSPLRFVLIYCEQFESRLMQRIWIMFEVWTVE